MDFNPGTGGTITADKLELQFFALVSKIQQLELNSTINSKTVNIISFTIRDDGICSGSANIFADISNNAGKVEIIYPDPFTGAGWIEGIGGDGNASNFAHALAERADLLARAERDPSLNPSGITPRFTEFSWSLGDYLTSPVIHNGLLSFSFSIPTEVVNTGDGETRKGAIYLPP